MSFEVVTAVMPEFVRVTASGVYSFEEMGELIAFVKKEADMTGRNRVLMDCLEVEGNMTEAERFRGGIRIAEVFGPRIKAALLMPTERITKLGELTAVNRGAKFLVTDSEAEALDWLRAS